jgi:cobalt/nickel transport system permease protein
MAVVMPFVGYGVYRLLAGSSALTATRRAVAAGIGSYVGINAAALFAAVEFGLQPDLFHRADGTPLYAPFHLGETIPAMAFAHLTIAGGVEFALTFGIITYLQRANLPLLRINHAALPAEELAAAQPARLRWRWAFVGIGTMIVLSPLGLLAPGGAFGEDAPQELDLGKYGLNAVPSGLNRYADFWSHTLLGGYGFSDGGNATLGYLLSALVGITVAAIAVLGVFWLMRHAQRRIEDEQASGGAAA